jgi:DNA-directed RNA polymerase III subunit RPC4
MRGGGVRGRGRGGAARGRAPPPVYQSLPAGPFGGPRPATSEDIIWHHIWAAVLMTDAARKGVSGPSSRQSPGDDERERYSDNDDDDIPIHQQSVIDIDQVSQMHESAPTSLYRDRKLNEKGGKIKVKEEKKKIKGKAKAVGDAPAPVANDLGVKAEPVSPTKPVIPLDPNEGVPPPGGWRDDDAMLSEDEEQDRDQDGRRVRSFANTGGNDSEDEEVNEAQMVDLSESEEEEEEDDLTADFTQVEGQVS